MLHIFEPITKYFKIKSIRTYDAIFGLHCQVTVALLISCAIIVSAKEYFGRAIDCISDEDDKDFVSTSCWVGGTFITKDLVAIVGQEAVSLGVTNESSNDDSKRIYQRYYPWIVLFLFLEAITFITPSYLWKIWEGGRLRQMCEDLTYLFTPKDLNCKKKELLISYFCDNNKVTHMCYALKYFFCELLNFLACVINIFMLDAFFIGFWEKIIPALSALSGKNWEEWDKRSSVIFPEIAKCQFYKYGSSGSLVNRDALCVLPLNMLNDKLFAALACWLMFLTATSAINVLYRLYFLCSSKLRMRLLRAQLHCMPAHQSEFTFGTISIGDWFLLYQVSRNLNPSVFRDIADELYEKKKAQVLNDVQQN